MGWKEVLGDDRRQWCGAHLVGGGEQGRRRQIDDDSGDGGSLARTRGPGAPRRMRHVEPGRMEGIPGVETELVDLDEADGMDPPRQHVRPAPRRGRGGHHGGAQQPSGQAVRKARSTASPEELEPAGGAVGDQPAARQPGALARAYRRRPEGGGARRAQRVTSATRRSSSSTMDPRSARRWRAAEASRITLPDLAWTASPTTSTCGASRLKVASKELLIGNRAELGRWRGEVRKRPRRSLAAVSLGGDVRRRSRGGHA